jgi:hypothetical protein
VCDGGRLAGCRAVTFGAVDESRLGQGGPEVMQHLGQAANGNSGRGDVASYGWRGAAGALGIGTGPRVCDPQKRGISGRYEIIERVFCLSELLRVTELRSATEIPTFSPMKWVFGTILVGKKQSVYILGPSADCICVP